MVENQSLGGVGVAEPTYWKIHALEGWLQRRHYGGKSKLREVGAAEPIWWKIKALEGWVQRSQYGGTSKP